MQTCLEDFKTEVKTTTLKIEEIENEIKEEENTYKYEANYQEFGDKKYEHLDVKEIAKLLRADYKSAFPDMKISVRISRYSMGQSITAQVKQIPRKYLLNWDEIEQHIICSNNYDEDNMDYFKEKYDNNENCIAFMKDAIYEQLQDIHNKYNCGEVEYYTDYYHTNYYGRCDVDGAEII